MKRNTDLAWEVIGHDSQLRQELASIEEHVRGDAMVEELLEFFAKVDGGVEWTWRLGDGETERLAAG